MTVSFAKKSILVPAVICALALLSAETVLAHGVGASIEKIVDGYLIDIGYEPSIIESGEQTRFDFLLHDAPADGRIPEDGVFGTPVEFSNAFVRIEQDSQLLFAGALERPTFGNLGFAYAFPFPGNYSIYVRYESGDETLVETEFEILVTKGENTATSGSSGAALIVGFLAGVLLATLWRGLRPSRLFEFRPSSFYRNSQNPTIPTGVSQAVSKAQSQKTFSVGLMAQLLVGLVCALLAYQVTSWYLAGEIKWPDFNFPALSFPDSTDRPATVPESSEVSVVLTERGFQPSELTVKQGTKVTFSTTAERPFWPASNLHPSHEIYSAFDPKRPIAANESWSFVFDQVGDWDMHDHIRSYFTGTIHVVQ